MKHPNNVALLFGLFTLTLSQAIAEEIPPSTNFKVEILVEGLEDAMEMAISDQGDVFIAERKGALKLFSPASGELKLVTKLEVDSGAERGLLGITLDPDFVKNGWIYIYHTPVNKGEHHLSRFTFKDGQIHDQKFLLSVPHTTKSACHEGGSIAFDSKGNLFLSTGDNTTPFESDSFAPLDERVDKENVDSQRSAGNTNDLRGKILRITPTPEGAYTIPEGNLFPKGMEKTRPEIFVMGCRNPWRIGVDQRTNAVYWGDVGPDSNNDGPRGPSGYCEINQATTAGNYGWPYFLGDNKPYADYDFATLVIGEFFNPQKPINKSVNNTGLEELPTARVPLWFEKRSCYCAGPVYYFDDYPDSSEKFPASMNSCLISYDWNNGKMQLTKLNQEGQMVWKKDFLSGKSFIHPSDVEFGIKGEIYVLEYGSAWRDNVDGKLKKVTYSEIPIVEEQGLASDSRLVGMDLNHQGTLLMSKSTCFSCHQANNQSVGPSFANVAKRYENQEGADVTLAKKILAGGSGSWGEVPMPPHPQFNEEQLSQIVDVILSVGISGHKESK